MPDLAREVIPLAAMRILPDERDAAFWLVIAVCAAASLFSLMTYVFAVRGVRTGTRLDRFYAWMRRRMTDAYFSAFEGSVKRHALFTRLQGSIVFGLWALVGLLAKVSLRHPWAETPVIVLGCSP